jgi:hypothetical protein
MTLRQYRKKPEDLSRTDWLIAAVLAIVIFLLFVMADMQHKAAAQTPRGPCRTIEEAKALAIANGSTAWIELNRDQWEFLRGIYILNPQTGAGFPSGDKAVLARIGDGGVIFWIDGPNACTPMKAPKQLVDMIDQVGQGFISHEGLGL